MRIRDLREDHDLTQTDVANYLQTSQQHYSLIELGKVDIKSRTLIKLAKFYGVSVDYLLGLTSS